MKKEEFDEKIRRKFGKESGIPPSQEWEKMKGMLDEMDRPGRIIVIPNFRLYLIAAAFITGVISVHILERQFASDHNEAEADENLTNDKKEHKTDRFDQMRRIMDNVFDKPEGDNGKKAEEVKRDATKPYQLLQRKVPVQETESPDSYVQTTAGKPLPHRLFRILIPNTDSMSPAQVNPIAYDSKVSVPLSQKNWLIGLGAGFSQTNGYKGRQLILGAYYRYAKSKRFAELGLQSDYNYNEMTSTKVEAPHYFLNKKTVTRQLNITNTWYLSFNLQAGFRMSPISLSGGVISGYLLSSKGNISRETTGESLVQLTNAWDGYRNGLNIYTFGLFTGVEYSFGPVLLGGKLHYYYRYRIKAYDNRFNDLQFYLKYQWK